MKANILEAIIGAVVLIIAGLFLVFVYSTSDESDSNKFLLKARFDRVDGLLVGNDVRLSGVKVGKIKAIEIVPDSFEVDITFSLHQDYKIPADSQAEILSESLLGGKYAAIVPGGDEEILKSGDEITNTQSAISWESLITKYFLNSDKNDDKKDDGSPSHHNTKHNDQQNHEKTDKDCCPPHQDTKDSVELHQPKAHAEAHILEPHQAEANHDEHQQNDGEQHAYHKIEERVG